MAKQRKILPARRQRNVEALLLRSAESLGRIIGLLQRELEGAISRFEGADDAEAVAAWDGHGSPRRVRARRAAAAPAMSDRGSTGKGRRKPGATTMKPTADRKSKSASRSAGAQKTTGHQARARKAARRPLRGS